MSSNQSMKEYVKDKFHITKPITITMWEFSWIERRWPGAGYEDWDQALSELKERGYDAIRMDAFPHLMAADPHKEWTLYPVWNLQDWGSRSINKIVLYDNLKNFLLACKRHGFLVALSTWFRIDEDRTLMNIKTPEDHGDIWVKTLDYIKEWGLLDLIFYVDLCNEYPLDCWAPFLKQAYGKELTRDSKESMDWMRRACAQLKKSYPEIPICFSFVEPFDNLDEDVSFMDLLELHIWMAQSSNYYDLVGYHYERFDDTGYNNLMLNGERIYREKPEYWNQCLKDNIRRAAEWSRKSGKPIITTECWGVVDYKDWPLLHWDWVKDMCEVGVKEALSTGRWAGVATSNFCGPQFQGMWRDVEWHKRLTDLVHTSSME
ncbi:MAG: hypothetical protein K0S76_241 [Herbinix sp.]|jgi:hypothetical protein|nr:hypothetical protein [Herbinix sp.]